MPYHCEGCGGSDIRWVSPDGTRHVVGVVSLPGGLTPVAAMRAFLAAGPDLLTHLLEDMVREEGRKLDANPAVGDMPPRSPVPLEAPSDVHSE